MNLPQISDFLGITNSRAKQQQQVPAQPAPEALGEKQILLEWEALSRSEVKETSRKFTRTFTVIGVIVALLLILMQEFFLILIVISVLFVTHALSNTPAEKIKYQVSNHGVQVVEHLYYWSELKQFFFITKEDVQVLAIDTRLGLPGRLFLTIYPQDKDNLKEIFSNHLVYLEKEPKTFFDTAYDTILQRFSFQETSDSGNSVK
jgi:hypothetical protein